MLRSPFHGLISKSLLLVTVTGRKSGKPITLPVNYSRQGDTITIISRRDRTWWRNLCGDSTVTLRLRGKEVKARGSVIQDTPGVRDALAAYVETLSKAPKYLRDTDQAAQTRVVVQVKI
jgi:deazaflavin-dependent oxidoreductase (nitroreductase family)